MRAEDCRPLDPQPDPEQAGWLRQVAQVVTASDLVVPLGGRRRDDDEPVVYCDWDGTWWAGRYIGTVTYRGRTLTIEPRFGLSTLRHWLTDLNTVLLPPASGQQHIDESFIVQLIAFVWADRLAKAARHGLPSLRQQSTHHGPTIRGRLDVPSTLRLRASQPLSAGSVEFRKTLAHQASAVIVAAHNVLTNALLGARWEPRRVTEVMAALRAAVGSRPRLPTANELAKVRYTPITAGFAPVADLSFAIARHRGLLADVNAAGRTTGVLLDVAELWERYVVNVTRSALPDHKVVHATQDPALQRHLLTSTATGRTMGRLIPDILVHASDRRDGVIDAKYKDLNPTQKNPAGPQNTDLYQMTAYLGRFTPDRYGWGILAYPYDPRAPQTPRAEELSPWILADGRLMFFVGLPHDHATATERLQAVLRSLP